MNGVMHVVADLGVATSLPGESGGAAAEEAPPVRAFVREWTLGDLAGALARVDGASPEHGRAVFEAASCLKCHSVDGEGASTGPALREVLGGRERADLLRQILEPSLEIREGYASEIFETTDGRLHAGRVVAESDAEILVQDDPYAEDLLVLTPDEIVERWPTSLSTMPEGLLSTFTRDEILDLLAYLESLDPGGR
jgi:putative heme-binding domain-containing protein